MSLECSWVLETLPESDMVVDLSVDGEDDASIFVDEGLSTSVYMSAQSLGTDFFDSTRLKGVATTSETEVHYMPQSPIRIEDSPTPTIAKRSWTITVSLPI
jgi:hypothetical protein